MDQSDDVVNLRSCCKQKIKKKINQIKIFNNVNPRKAYNSKILSV